MHHILIEMIDVDTFTGEIKLFSSFSEKAQFFEPIVCVENGIISFYFDVGSIPSTTYIDAQLITNGTKNNG